MISLYSTIRNALAGLALAVASAGGAQALTVDVTVRTEVFTIGTITGSFAENQTELESQPWWDDVASANNFALRVSDSLGLPNASAPFLNASGTPGPLFAAATAGDLNITDFDPGSIFSRAWRDGSVGGSFISPTSSATYAVVESVAPIPLPPAAFLLLGGLGALGLVKKRRA